jgi:hypothetical protein
VNKTELPVDSDVRAMLDISRHFGQCLSARQRAELRLEGGLLLQVERAEAHAHAVDDEQTMEPGEQAPRGMLGR